MYNLSVNQRKDYLNNAFEQLHNLPASSFSGRELSLKWEKVFDQELPAYFAHKPNNISQMKQYFDDFTTTIIPILENLLEKTLDNDANIYQLCNVRSLAAANAITRTFSTKLGLFWEKLANLSPLALSPEIEFGIRIEGVDTILVGKNSYIYAQLKTQKNTLTGSQANRVKEELGGFNDAIFVACIETNTNWTYSGPIKRVVGEAFWKAIGINYELLLSYLQGTLSQIEHILD